VPSDSEIIELQPNSLYYQASTPDAGLGDSKVSPPSMAGCLTHRQFQSPCIFRDGDGKLHTPLYGSSAFETGPNSMMNAVIPSHRVLPAIETVDPASESHAHSGATTSATGLGRKISKTMNTLFKPSRSPAGKPGRSQNRWPAQTRDASPSSSDAVQQPKVKLEVIPTGQPTEAGGRPGGTIQSEDRNRM
jgi:hypothetical protein